ncbi:MAG: SagB/ThcOx family dehydrogenase [Desulfobacterales bacterium]|jgi:SagB-type dehydrogenase family enzyme|nr:SagB/ThcOx family dehydrogenase [Desulfobacterales bacterium]
MRKKIVITLCLAVIALYFFSTFAVADEIKPIQLPAPQMDGGKPLMQALKDRRTSRDFSAEKLSLQTLSNLLWAAGGVNREDSGKRTAPTARDWREIDIYVAMQEGLFLYDPSANLLKPVLSEDIREMTGKQPFVKEAPVNLIFVANYSRMGGAGDEDKRFYAATDTGYISQNIYLFCASEGLATVVRGYVDREALAKKMNLAQDQAVTLAQTVGYPKK